MRRNGVRKYQSIGYDAKMGGYVNENKMHII